MGEPLPADFAVPLRLTAPRRGPIGEPLHFFSETTSTNDVAARLAEQGVAEGSTVVALAQTAGRGRLGRTWYSPAGAGLYVSVIFRTPGIAPYLTLAGGVAVAEGITRATGLPLEIKWPNDIVTRRAEPREPWRKLAGILAEAASGPGGVQHVVLGFGINLQPAAYPPEIAGRATSIETELGRPVDAGTVLAETLAALAAVRARLADGDTAGVLEQWRDLAPGVQGRAVEWESGDALLTGTTAGIDDAGALLVRTAAGLTRIISGDVRWR